VKFGAAQLVEGENKDDRIWIKNGARTSPKNSTNEFEGLTSV
jgi:hypothetical protein